MHRVAFFETAHLKVSYLFPPIFGLTFIVLYFQLWDRFLFNFGLKIDPKGQFMEASFQEQFTGFSDEVAKDSDRLVDFFRESPMPQSSTASPQDNQWHLEAA